MAAKDVPASAEKSWSMAMVVYGVKKKFPSVGNVTCEEVQVMRGDLQTLCLDTRPVEEYAVSHIPGATRVEPDNPQPGKLVDTSLHSRVVCYCSVGYRSSQLATRLKEHLSSQGHQVPVFNMEGGVFQWAIEGRPLEGSQPDTVHQYSSFWGKLLPSRLRHSNL